MRRDKHRPVTTNPATIPETSQKKSPHNGLLMKKSVINDHCQSALMCAVPVGTLITSSVKASPKGTQSPKQLLPQGVCVHKECPARVLTTLEPSTWSAPLINLCLPVVLVLLLRSNPQSSTNSSTALASPLSPSRNIFRRFMMILSRAVCMAAENLSDVSSFTHLANFITVSALRPHWTPQPQDMHMREDGRALHGTVRSV